MKPLKAAFMAVAFLLPVPPSVNQTQAVMTQTAGLTETFYTAAGEPREVTIHTASIHELKAYIRHNHGLSDNAIIDLKKYEDEVDAYIDLKFKEIPGAPKGDKMEESKATLKKSLMEDREVGSAIAVYHYTPTINNRHAVVGIGDTKTSTEHWIADFLRVSPQSIQGNHGLNGDILKDWVYYHETGHGTFQNGMTEGQADRYATFRILKKYPINDETVRTLQFLSDFRRGRAGTLKYATCADNIDSMITPENLARFKRYKSHRGHAKPVSSVYRFQPEDEANNNEQYRAVYNATQIFREDLKNDGSHLSTARMRAEFAMMSDPENRAKYTRVDLAAARLQTLLSGTNEPSAYARMRPVSAPEYYNLAALDPVIVKQDRVKELNRLRSQEPQYALVG